MAKKAMKKDTSDEGHSHDHAEHDHSHAGHDHAGHDHSHEGHDHGEHIPHTKVTPRKPNTSGVAEEGNVVLVHYKGTLDNGEMFDSSDGREPIEFVLGEHMVIRGFEEAITGMTKGQKKKITIESQDAYGDVNPELRQDVPREALGEITPEVGMMLALQHPMAPQPIPVKVIGVTPENVTIDLNHPLAGQRLHFDLELVEIR
jgi:FKBP-type peptidyl-prolyl cis-trans isomerase 2